MPDVCRSMCQLFVDDAKIFRSVCTTDDIIKLQDDLNKLTEWSAKWQLPFNMVNVRICILEEIINITYV